MNAELLKQALLVVLDPHVLVNLVSRRVRQLNGGHGATSRPLLADATNLGAADIALLEIIEGKIGFDMPKILDLTDPPEGTDGGRKAGSLGNKRAFPSSRHACDDAQFVISSAIEPGLRVNASLRIALSASP